MKLNEVKPYLESSGELEEQSFGIQDPGMLFDILRNKMYSNPILAICREISCNARDAHREVGTPDLPIQIYLPNNLEPYYKIRDFGPGISPDRMSNVFIKYTASTKRTDNVQTGGFGLGAKTPFSYADTFNITTVVNGIKYTYNCVIDETKVGKIMLTSQSRTKEKNGTEIMIPVLPKDFGSFATYTEQACEHWTIKPIIRGGTISWKELKFNLKGSNWGITASGGYSRQTKLIVDDIEYPLDIQSLRNYADAKLIDSVNGNLIMYFGVGELSLSANRESVYLDERTKHVIRERLAKIIAEIKQEANNKIASFTNLWDANIYFNSVFKTAFHKIDFLGSFSWNGILLTHHFVVETDVFTFTKGKYSRRHGTDPNKISRDRGNIIYFEKDVVVYINDTTIKEPTPRHVKKEFETNANLKKVYVINVTEKHPQDVLIKKHNLDKINVKLLSSITKTSGRAYTPPSQRVLVFKLKNAIRAFRQVSYSSIDEDTNPKVLCLLDRDFRTGVRYAVLNKRNVDFDSFTALVEKYPNYSFYGVDDDVTPERIEEDFSDFISLNDFVQKNIIDNKNFDYVKSKYAIRYNPYVDSRILKVANQMEKLVKDPNSLSLKRLKAHKEIREIATADSGLLILYEIVKGVISDTQFREFEKNNPHLNINQLNNLFNQKYPLLSHIQSYNFKDIVGALAGYINLIDKEKTNG